MRSSERPAFRPADLRLAMGEQPAAAAARHGGRAVCGRGSLRGERHRPVRGRGDCGIRNAVRVTRVGGLALHRPARMDCDTARALDDWVRDGVLPTVGRTGGGAVGLRVAAGYCLPDAQQRPRARN